MAENENNISGRVGLDITDFKANIAELNRQIRVIDTGFKAAAAGMGDWGSSAEGLQARIKALSDITDLQRKKVEALTAEYQKVAAEKGADSKAAQDLQIRINKETESLNKNELELKQTTEALNNFSKEKDQASEKTNKFGGAISKVTGTLGKIGGVVAQTAAAGVAAVGSAAAGAAVGVWKMAESASSNADEVQRLSDVTGLSAEQVQKLTYAGKNLGVEFDTIAGAQSRLIKSMSAAAVGKNGPNAQAEAFAKLGIKIRDANGNLRDSQTVFNEVITKLGGVSNETERDAIAMQLFGRSARELNPLIKAGGDELARLTAEAEKNGAVLSNEQIAALDAFGDSVDALKMSFQGLAGSVSATVLPILNSLVGNVQNVVGAISQAVKTGDWSQVGTAISTGLNAIVQQITGFIPKLLTIVSSVLGGLVNAIVTAIPQILPALISAVLQLLNTIVQTLSTNGPLLIQAAVQAITTLVTGIAQALPQIIQAAIGIITALINGITQALPQLIPAAVQILLALVQGIISALPQLIQAALQMIQALADGLLKALPQLIAALPKIIDAIITFLIKALPQIIQAGVKILVALIQGIANALPQLIQMIPTIVQTIVTVIIQNLPLIISAALQIMIALAIGLIQNIPVILKAIPDIFRAVVKGFAAVDWGQVGRDLISGISSGVASAAKGLVNSVVQAAKDALKSVKNFLGISSPSKVMRDQVGRMIGAGMAEGIADSTRAVNTAMNQLNRQIAADGNINIGTTTSAIAAGQQTGMAASANRMVSIAFYWDSKVVAEAIAPLSDLIQGKNLKLVARSAGI